MSLIQVFVFAATTVLWCDSAFSQPTGIDHHVAEEKAIQEACPERIAMKDSTGNGIRVPVGHRYDLQSHSVKRCLTVAEAKPAIDEEKAIMETCPERIAMKDSTGNGIRVPVGHRYDLQSHSVKRCLTVTEGESTAAEKKASQENGKLARPKNLPIPGGGGRPSSSTHQETAPVLTNRSLQTRIEVSEKIIGDLPSGGMQQAANEKLTQAKHELQAGNLEDSRKSLREANEYALLAGKPARDSANVKNVALHPEDWGKATLEDLPHYGNFGGKGYTGGYDVNQSPINRMDELFQKHDNDYRAAKNEDAILLADKELVAELEKIDENNILVCKRICEGGEGKFYKTLEDDLTRPITSYRNLAKISFRGKIAISEASLARQKASAGSGQDIAKRVIGIDDKAGQAAAQRAEQGLWTNSVRKELTQE